MVRRLLIPLGVALALLVGCATAAPAPVAQPAGLPATATAAATATAESRPTRLLIPAIAVDAELIDLGLQPDGSLEVPPDGSTAGWYTGSPTPGETGPSVLAAHVDWHGEQGVFYHLRDVQPGDEVRVERADGSAALFRVGRVEQYPKDSFPTAEVYGDVPNPQLRLITCGGDFDDDARSYVDNIVVYADAV